MKATSKLLFLCLIFFCLCGFSSKFNIKVLQQDHNLPLFELSKTSFFQTSGNVEINTFLVVRKNGSGEWDYKSPMWAFDIVPGSAKPLSTIAYGQVPPGFTEKTKAIALADGVHYLAVGLSPGSGGSAEFVAQ